MRSRRILDRLAQQAVRYTHAFTTAGVCAPCRSSIITGMYQNSIGTHHMRCTAVLPKWLKPFPIALREAGYYCTNNSKTDYQFKVPSSSTIWDQSSGKAHWANRPDKNQPFFAVFNFTGCHESGIASSDKYASVTKDLTADQRQDAAALTTLPPYYPDTEITREDWKRNYELITAMDAWAGDLIAELKDAGEYENTIIFFWSDHGVGLPRAKRWLYDSGTHIPLIIRIPERFRHDGQGRPDTVDDQLVSSVDFGPTVLNCAGLPIPDYVQGRAFPGRRLSPPRDYVYGARDRMDERYDIIRTRSRRPVPIHSQLRAAQALLPIHEHRRERGDDEGDPASGTFGILAGGTRAVFNATPNRSKNSTTKSMIRTRSTIWHPIHSWRTSCKKCKPHSPNGKTMSATSA